MRVLVTTGEIPRCVIYSQSLQVTKYVCLLSTYSLHTSWCHQHHIVLSGENVVAEVQSKSFLLLRCTMSQVLVVKLAETVTAAQRHIAERTVEGVLNVISSQCLSAILDALAT